MRFAYNLSVILFLTKSTGFKGRTISLNVLISTFLILHIRIFIRHKANKKN
jgi:hypothetical protein